MNSWLIPNDEKLKMLFQQYRLVSNNFKARIVPQTHTKRTYTPTNGLTNLVLHARKTQHTIMNTRKKTEHLFRGI